MERRSVELHRLFGVRTRTRDCSTLAAFVVPGMASKMDAHVVHLVQPRVRWFVALLAG